MSSPLRIVVLGAGKTGSLVASIAAERGHQVRTVKEDENRDGSWLTGQNLGQIDVAVDFTTPHAVVANIEATVRQRKSMVVGTTGWYQQLPRVQTLVEQFGTGFVYGANFSYGVNLFFHILRAAAPALAHGYSRHILERHHIQKKDAPSGTAIAVQGVLEQATGKEVEITSERQGEVTGLHTLELESAGDRIVLTHEAKSRRTFAEGAVLATEWIAGRKGFYDFKDIFAQL